MEPEGRIYVEVDNGEGAQIYEAFCVRLTENGASSDYGFLLYLSQLYDNGNDMQVRVLTEAADRLQVLYEGQMKSAQN